MLLAAIPSALRERDHSEPGRQHQGLLTAGHQRVDAPCVHLLLEHADRSDPIDDEHHVAALRDLADCGNRMYRAGRGFAGLHENRARLGMLLERVLDLLGAHRATPFDFDLMRHHPESGEHLAPSLAELAAIDEDGVLAGREQVDDRRLHRAGAGRGKEEDFLPGAEERP